MLAAWLSVPLPLLSPPSRARFYHSPLTLFSQDRGLRSVTGLKVGRFPK